MIVRQRFIRFAAVCCFLSVITALGIHVYFPDPPASFEERLQLYRNTTYLVNRWWVVSHCLLVIFSMWGFALLQFRKAPGTVGIGFLFFGVFSIAEITRQMMVLFYINRLREQFVAATDATVIAELKAALMSAGLMTAPLFGLFILAFGLGSLFYGLSLTSEKGFSRILAIMFLISATASFVLLGNDFWQHATLGNFMDKYNSTFTPLLRLLVGIWLWKKSNQKFAAIGN
jgi:hypothetical protein